MFEFGKLMLQASPYDGMPLDVQTHQLGCSIYRCAAAAAGATFQNVEKPSQLHPSFGFRLLIQQPHAESLKIAQQILQDWHDVPCLMDPWWFEHATRFNTTTELISPTSLAIIIAEGEAIDVDNASVEGNNASIRRFVRRCVQQKVCDLRHLSSSWVLK